MRPPLTVLGTVQQVERTALGHLCCGLEDDSGTYYGVLADPHPLMSLGQRIYAVLAPLPRFDTDTPIRWHLLWCRSERMPSVGCSLPGAPDGVPSKD